MNAHTEYLKKEFAAKEHTERAYKPNKCNPFVRLQLFSTVHALALQAGPRKFRAVLLFRLLIPLFGSVLRLKLCTPTRAILKSNTERNLVQTGFFLKCYYCELPNCKQLV